MGGAALVFAVACLYPWMPGFYQKTVAETPLRDPVPAGEISARVHIAEEVIVPARSLADSQGPYCVGLLFATYQRANKGHLSVAVTQGNDRAQWTVPMSRLEDNKSFYACPSFDLDPRKQFSVLVDGKDGEEGSSATLWLTSDLEYGSVTLGGSMAPKSLQLSITSLSPTGGMGLSLPLRWAFLICGACSLLTALAALLWLGLEPGDVT